MLYCEICRVLCEDRCLKPGHRLRSPRENDPVLLLKADSIRSGMLEEMLKRSGIPVLKQGHLGAGLTTWTGPMMEEYSLYVPYAAYEQALALVTPPEGDDEEDTLGEEEQWMEIEAFEDDEESEEQSDV